MAGDRAERHCREGHDGGGTGGRGREIAGRGRNVVGAPDQQVDAQAGDQPRGQRQEALRRGQAPGEPHEVEAREWQADDGGRAQTRRDGRQNARGIGPAFARRERPAEDDEADKDAENAELDLGQRGNDGKHRGELAAIPQQRSQTEKHEERADDVRLAPDRAVEPGDGIEQDDRGRAHRPPPRRTQLLRHHEDDTGQGQVREDRDQLDRLTDATERRDEQAQDPQEEQVDGGIVQEAGLVVEPHRALRDELAAPSLERSEVGREARPRQ